MNSALANHTNGATVTKFIGNYRIVEDTINFTDAPKGEKGPTGLTTTSTFMPRAFTRTGTKNGTQDTYANNYVFDSIENQFTGVRLHSFSSLVDKMSLELQQITVSF